MPCWNEPLEKIRSRKINVSHGKVEQFTRGASSFDWVVLSTLTQELIESNSEEALHKRDLPVLE